MGTELEAIDRAIKRMGAAAAIAVAPSAVRFAVAAALVAGAGDGSSPSPRAAVPADERCQLDFCSTAQAMATDRAAQVGESVGGEAALVALGGDIATSGCPPSGWWTVRALGPARAFADWTVSLRCGGVATSSLESRMPALEDDVWLAASVAAGSCVEAKVAAAAVLGLGLQAPGWLDEHRLAARLVARDGTVITLGGWPDAPVRTRPIPGSRW